MTDVIQFKEGDTMSVFEGTHHVRGHRSTKFIGRVVGFDPEINMWKVVSVTMIPTRNPFLNVNPNLALHMFAKGA